MKIRSEALRKISVYVIGHCSLASILIGCSENSNLVFFSLRRKATIRKMGGYIIRRSKMNRQKQEEIE
jgi:hypothetical protein